MNFKGQGGLDVRKLETSPRNLERIAVTRTSLDSDEYRRLWSKKAWRGDRRRPSVKTLHRLVKSDSGVKRKPIEDFIGVVSLFFFLLLPLKGIDSRVNLHRHRLGGKNYFLSFPFDIHVFLIESFSLFHFLERVGEQGYYLSYLRGVCCLSMIFSFSTYT